MRSACFTILIAGFLGACGPAPGPKVVTRAAQGDTVTPTGKVSIVIPQPHGVVTASLDAGARKCLNRRTAGSVLVQGAFGPQSVNVTTGYSSIVMKRGGLTELLIDETIVEGGSIVPRGSSRFLLDATPAIDGTRLDFYGGWQERATLSRAVESWARTGDIRCPFTPV